VPGTARSQGRLDVGAVIVRVPGGNLRQALDHAVPRGQVRGVQARDQPADGVPAAAQVLGHLSLGYRGGGLGVLGVQRVHRLAAYLGRLAGDELADPAGQVLVRVRDVIDDHRHWPGITIEGCCAPFPVGAAADEADQPVSGRLDIGRIGRRGPRIVRHGSHPTNRHTLQVKPRRKTGPPPVRSSSLMPLCAHYCSGG
jgi:hypothetical protein